MSFLEVPQIMQLDGARFGSVEFMGSEHPTRYYEFDDGDGLVCGYAALREFGDSLVDEGGAHVNEEAADVDEQISIYLPREYFYADEPAFIARVREFYD